ncbi:MAG: FHA domain-containing protein [Phycisphaerales bacterium]|nr:FHA domain-containing protein [Phycisphaerales bacterium]
MAEESPLNGRPAGNAPSLIPQGHHLGKPPVPLNRPATLIGARHNAHLHLLSRHVSKAHALIVNEEGHLYLRDLQSRTHTFVNGEAVTEADLKPGDVIDVGSFRFRVSAKARVRSKEASGAPPAAMHVNGGEMPIPLEQRVILIGRRPTCDISLIEESASTAHAVIYEYAGGRMIRDLGSRTGTFVNGRRVRQQALEFGDQVRIGETDMRYMPAEEQPAEVDELEHLVGTAPLGVEGTDRAVSRAESPAEDPSLVDQEAALPPTEPLDVSGDTAIDLDHDPDVGNGNDTATIPIPLADVDAGRHEPKLSDQVVEEPEGEQEPESDPPQVLVSRDLHEEKLSSSATHPDLQKAAAEALEQANESPADVQAEEEAVEDEKPVPVTELDGVDFGPPKLDMPEPSPDPLAGVDLADELNEPPAIDQPVAPLDFTVDDPSAGPIDEPEKPLIAMDVPETKQQNPPADEEPIDSAPTPVSVTPRRKVRRRSPKDRARESVMEKTEPTPESAQGLKEIIGELPGIAPASAEISDSQLDRAIEQFSGSRNDPVVESADDEISVEDLLKPVSEDEVPPLELSVEEPPIKPIPPVVEEESEPLKLEGPEPTVADVEPVEQKEDEPLKPEIAPPVPEKPRAVEPVKMVGISPPAEQSTESIGYLGGMPLQLPKLQEPVEAASAPSTEPPLEHPPLRRPGMVMPPRPKVKPSAFARQRVQVPAEETPVFEDVEVPPFAGGATAARGQVTTGFDGLAMPPVREVDVFSQMQSPASDDPVFGGEGHGVADAPAAEPSHDTAEDHAHAAQMQPPRDPFGTVPLAAAIPPGKTAERRGGGDAPNIPPTKRKRWSVPLLVFLMLLCAALAGGGAWYLMPRQSRVEAAITFVNLSTEQSRRQIDQQLQTMLGEAEMRSSAKAIYRVKRGSEAEAGFLDDAVDYTRMLSEAKWTGPDSSTWVIGRQSAAAGADEARLTALMSALYADQRIADQRLAYEKVKQQLRDLNGAIEQSQRMVEQRSAEIAEIEGRLHGLRTAGDLAALEREAAAAEKSWHEAAERSVQLKGELERARQSPTTRPGTPSSVAAALADDQELRNMRASLDDLKMRLERVRVSSHSQADEARKRLDDAAQRLQQQIADVQRQMRDNPELQNYVAAVAELQNAVQELTAEFMQGQKEQADRIAGLKRLLDEKMEARRSKIWENDKELKDLNEQLALTSRQYNAALSGGDETAQQAEKLKEDVSRLEDQIRRRRELLGDDSVYAEAINQLQQIIDDSQKQLADSRRRTEEMLQKVQRSVLAAQPPAQRLPAEQQALAAELEKRLEELNEARRQYAQAVQNGQESEPARMIAEDIATIQNRIDERTRQLTAAQTRQSSEQEELARLQAVEQLRNQLTEAQQAESTAREAYFQKSKQLQSAREDIDRRLAGLSQRDQAAQELKARRDRLDALVAQSKETAYPEPAKVTIAGMGADFRPTYAASAAGIVVLLFAVFIAAAARGARQAQVPMAGAIDDADGKGELATPHHPNESAMAV